MPFDLEVLAKLIRLARRLKTSCWTTIKFLADELHVSEATIKRSLSRLQRAGLIRHVQVEKPDPDEPRNRTGWRYVFAWMESGPPCAPAGSSVTPPGDQARPLPGLIRDPQHKTEGNPILPKEGKNEINLTTTADAAGSPSDFSSLNQEEKTLESAAPSAAEPDPAYDEAIKAAGDFVTRPAGAVRKILREIDGSTPAMIVAACRKAKARGKSNWGFVRGVVGNMVEEGTPAPPKPVDNSHRYVRAPEEYVHPKHRKATEEARAAEKARAGAMTPEERRAEGASLLELRREHGQDFVWDEPTQGYHPIVLDPARWSPSAGLQAIVERMELFRPEVRAILDAERAAPGYVDPREVARQRRERQLEEQRLKAEADAKAKRRDEVRALIDQAGRLYFAITDAGDGLELVDAFPAGDVSPDEKARIERAKLCRQGIRGRLLKELNEAAAEVREALAARSEVAS